MTTIHLDRLFKPFEKMWGTLAVVMLSLIALGVGFGLSAAIFPRPKIGIVHIDTVIDPFIRPYFTIPLTYAAENRDVAGVVLLVDSPGGEASTSEELFYRVVDLREDKPVVATISRLGASGAYYTAIGANYIYAKPAALVGSIGVIAGIPQSDAPSEFNVTTGPFKGSGSSQVDWIRSIDVIKESFVTNVEDQRLYALDNMHDDSRIDVLPDKDQIATGRVWIAPVAYDIGLIDALGSDVDAIKMAAQLAHVRNYEVIDLTTLAFFDDPTFIFQANPPDITSLALPQVQAAENRDGSGDYIDEGLWPVFYHMYIPPSE